MVIITGGKVFFQGAFHRDLDIAIQGERIAQIGPELDRTGCDVIDAAGKYISPGFVDLHIHAIRGADTMEGAQAIEKMANALVEYGVTSFLPTTVAASLDSIRGVLESFMDVEQRSGAKVLGFHLEGPFINVACKGALDPKYILPASLENYEKMVGRAGGLIRQITMAPDIEGALELASILRQRGVTVSIGHTGAGYELMQAAVEAGFTHVTHLFNGMTPLHHREPGPAGSALSDDRLTAELIADTVHLHPAILNLAAKCKGPDRACLISDSISATGLGDGVYHLGELTVIVKDSMARIPAGNLAGSTLTMDVAVRNMILKAGLPAEKVIPMASRTPAREAGSMDRGALEPGYIADIVLLDGDWRLRRTIARGVTEYQSEQ